MWIFDPPGSPCIGLPPTVMPFILKKYHHALSRMYICGYFVLSNDPNREVIWIIPIFRVIFGQNVGFRPPGVSMYMVALPSFAINLEETPSCIVLIVLLVLLCMIKWSKQGRYLDNFNIWGHFSSKTAHLTPGVSMYRVTPHCYAIQFEEIPSCFVLNV